jgi:hypothetical protein
MAALRALFNIFASADLQYSQNLKAALDVPWSAMDRTNLDHDAKSGKMPAELRAVDEFIRI